MANLFQGPPAADFYGMLSGLGDTLQNNAKLQAQRQTDQVRKAAFSDFTALDPRSPDYGKQAITIAQKLGQAGDQDGAVRFLGLAQTAADRARQDQRDSVTDQHWNQSFGLQKRAADRADDPTPANFVRDPSAPSGYRPIGPATPAYQADVARAKAEAEAASAAIKPYPVETLSGTKFMVKNPAGGFSLVDPNTLAGPAFAAQAGQPAPAPVVPAVPAQSATMPQTPMPQPAPPAPGSFADRYSGASPQAASAGPAPAPAPPAQPVDLTAVDPATGRRENWLKAQSPETQAYIKKISDYEIDPRTTSIKGGHREQVLSAVARYDPTYDQNSFGSRAKAIRDFATGTQGNAVRSFDVAIDHLDTLQRYSDALKSGDMRLINSLRNKWLTETGSPLPTNVQAVAPIVGAEISKAIIGSNNALADREELRKPLQIANSPEQISGAIQGYKSLMAGQLKGLKKQYEDTTGKKDFDNRVREGTRKALLGTEASQGMGADAMLQHAKEAIAQGAPRDAVLKRLKDAGIDAGSL
jgi:hypothetical protein